MAYNDPQTVGASTLPRTGLDRTGGVFRSADGNTVLEINHNRGKRVSSTAKVTFTKTAPDPLISDRNIRHSMTVYVTVNTPLTGFTVDEIVANLSAAYGNLSAGTNANAKKLAGGEA